MSSQPPVPGSGEGNPNEPQLALQSVYLKDCSFESPNGPRVQGEWNPQISLDLHTGVSEVSEELREVLLTVTVGAKQNDATVFLVEVKQGGLFLMRNLAEGDVARAVGSICPNVLFPYARAVISHMVSQGGFPQLLLPPVNFDALFAQSIAAAQQQQQNQTTKQ